MLCEIRSRETKKKESCQKLMKKHTPVPLFSTSVNFMVNLLSKVIGSSASALELSQQWFAGLFIYVVHVFVF